MRDQRAGIALIEEAVALVRHASARTWFWYLAGAIPFFAALLFYVGATTGNLSVPDPGPWSLLLALLFAWRQICRSIFGRLIASDLSGTAFIFAPSLWPLALARMWFAASLRVAVPLPFPFLSVLFRNYQSYAWDEEFAFRRAASTAARSGSATVSWLTLWLIGFVVWVNLLTGMIALPLLYRIFSGEENVLTSNIGALLNRTVLISALMVAWCLCDVVMEAMCALHRFYGESQRTGADLLRAWRKAVAGAAVGVLLTCVAGTMHAQQTSPNLNRAIDQVLTSPQYQWRQPPAPNGQESTFVKWLRGVVTSIRRTIRAIFRPIRRWWDAFMRWLQGRNEGRPESGPAPPVDALRLGTLLVLVLLAGGLIALLMRSGLLKRTASAPLPAAQPIPVDLNSPDVTASDLAEEQWLKLAREWTEKGEPRLALRAWFLACLAWLHARELIVVSRNKSNLDYRRELSRRARSFPGLTDIFAASVQRFESAWYGDYPVGRDDVERFAAGVAQMRSLVA